MIYKKNILRHIYIYILVFSIFPLLLAGADSRTVPVTATYCDNSTITIYPYSFVTKSDASTFNCYSVQTTPIIDGYRYGFEDGSDMDYNDVIIELWVTGNGTASPVAHVKFVSSDASYKHWVHVVYGGTDQFVFKAEVASPGTIYDIALPTRTCPDFQIKGDPTSRTITQGQSTFYTFTIQASGGFSNSVNLSISGLPTGATGAFDINPLPVTGESKLTIDTTKTTAIGTYTLTITGTSGTKTHTETVTLIINELPPEPDFAILATPTSNTIVQGDSTFYTLSISTLNGFSDSVNLSISGLPTGASGAFDINPLTVAKTSKLTVDTTKTTAVGTYTLTITGTSGTKTRTKTVSLTINELPLEPDFRVIVSPQSRTIFQGESTVYTNTIKVINGFTGMVNLSVSGLPTGAAGTFENNPLAVSQESNLTITTATTTPVGSYNLTITGTSGNLTHKSNLILVVNAIPTNPDFTITASPDSVSISKGETASYSITITPIQDFNSTVKFSIAQLPAGTTSLFNPNPAEVSQKSTLTLSTTQETPTGTYSLTITGEGGGKTHTASIQLTVGCPEFTPSISASPQKGTAPLTVSFQPLIQITGGSSPTGFTYRWDFGDGTISTQENIQHIYNNIGTYKVTLYATDSCQTTKSTSQTITVENQLPQVSFHKSVDKSSAKPNEILSYTILIKNNDSEPITSVKLTDELPSSLTLISQQSPLSFVQQGNLLTWTGTISAGGQVSIVISVRIRPDVKAGDRIENRARVTADQMNGKTVTSNTVETVIESEPISITKVLFHIRSDIPQTEVGRVVRFNITLSNMSTSGLLSPEIETDLPQGFAYVVGSSTLNGQHLEDPTGSRRLIWQIQPIGPGVTTLLSFQGVIGADVARGKNIIRAALRTRDNSGQDISLEDSIYINVSSSSFIFYSSIDGTVYIDRDGDEFYTMADTPLSGIEVIMSTGQRTITDSIGHYQFESLFPGEYALSINRFTLPEKYRAEILVSKLVTLSDGLSDTVDFGVKFKGEDDKRTARFEGRVFYDKNQDKAYDPSDALVKDFSIKLDGNDLTKGSNGKFVFTLLEPGHHSIEVTYDNRTLKQEILLVKGDNLIDVPLPFTGIKIVIRSQQ